MAEVPQSFLENSASLDAVEAFTLLKLQVSTPTGVTTWRFCLQKTLIWKSQVWALTPFSLTGEGDRAGGEQTRPTLVLPNPEGLFSYYVSEGFIDRARVFKYSVHPDDLNSGKGVMSTWYVSRVAELNDKAFQLELSGLSDGNNFKLPARRFTPPEFGMVRL